jgi:acyl-coenzyme A thioesterase PaaI-like protein
MVKQLESRAQAGKPGTSITLQGRPVELHKIRRYMKTQVRADTQGMVFMKPTGVECNVEGPVLPFANSM